MSAYTRFDALAIVAVLDVPEWTSADWVLFGVVVSLAALALLALILLVYGDGRRRSWGLALVFGLTAIGLVCALAPRRPDLGSLADPAAMGRPVKAKELGYVSSDTCRTCHSEEYASWHGSFHRTMTQVVGPDTVLSDWDTNLQIRGRDYRLYRDGDEYWVDMVDPGYGQNGRDIYGDFIHGDDDTVRVQKRAVLSTGSHHQQVYWFSAGEGRSLFLLPFTWLINEARWIPYEDSFLRPRYQVGTTEVWNEQCVRCHSTGSQPRFAGKGIESDTRLGEFGISCEACHGPGEEHIRANQSPYRRYLLHLTGTRDSTMVHPKKLPAERANDLCGQCHAVSGLNAELEDEWRRTGYRFRPGDRLLDTRIVAHRPDQELDQYTRFVADQFSWDDGMVRVSGRDYNGILDSECARGGELSCLSCHSMHLDRDDSRSISTWADDQLTLGMESDLACLQCHKSFADAVSAHTHHPAESSGSRCYNCHMPHTTYGLLKAIRSHTFGRSPSVRESVEVGRPNACNLCHLDKSLGWTGRALEDWYGQPGETELVEEDETRSAALLWLLRGDPAQRAITAWHMGWAPATEVSGSDWMPPFLAEALVDSYSGVRFIAGRSLQRIPGFEDLAYDYVAPLLDLGEAKREVQARWRGMHSIETFQTRSPLFFDSDGEFDFRAVRDVLLRRDRRHVHISE
jgi:hypothetical protein